MSLYASSVCTLQASYGQLFALLAQSKQKLTVLNASSGWGLGANRHQGCALHDSYETVDVWDANTGRKTIEKQFSSSERKQQKRRLCDNGWELLYRQRKRRRRGRRRKRERND